MTETDKFLQYLDTIKPMKLNGTVYDIRYQSIELPDRIISGYQNKAYEDHTWNTIKNIVNWKDKSVADIGCLNGLYSFRIKELGAGKVVGYDLFQQACDVAIKISKLKNLDVNFRTIDISKYYLSENYDVILLLNILHHCPDPIFTLNEVFNKSKCVIMEVQFDGFGSQYQIGWKRLVYNMKNMDKSKVIKIGRLHNHQLIKTLSSARPFREILVFKK